MICLIGGADAFVVTVDDTTTVADAVLEKRIPEVAGLRPDAAIARALPPAE